MLTGPLFLFASCGFVPLASLPHRKLFIAEGSSSQYSLGFWDGQTVIYNSTSQTTSFLLGPNGQKQATVQVICNPLAFVPTEVNAIYNNREKPILQVTHRSGCPSTTPSHFPIAPAPTAQAPLAPPPISKGDLVVKGYTFNQKSPTSCSGTPSAVAWPVAPTLNTCVDASGSSFAYKVTQCDDNGLVMQTYPAGSQCGSATPFGSLTYAVGSCEPDAITGNAGSFYLLGCSIAA